jgi:chemotaxis response regulator CheB
MAVLHRPPDAESFLREVLSRRAGLPVCIARDGERLRAGTCYIGEPDAHLTLLPPDRCGLVRNSALQYRNRTIDLLFGSLAQHAGRRAVGIVLSGALDDGARGLAAIGAAGGMSMVATPDGRPFRGMPENAIAQVGAVDLIARPALLARGVLEAEKRFASRNEGDRSADSAAAPPLTSSEVVIGGRERRHVTLVDRQW